MPSHPEIEYDLREDDIVAFFRDHSRQGGMSPVAGLLAMMLGVTVSLNLAAALWVIAAGNPLLLDSFKIIWIISVAFLVLLFVVMRRRMPHWLLRRGKNAKIICRHRLTLTPERLLHTTPYGSDEMLWSALERIAVSDHHAFFYTGTNTAHVLPRRAFAEERDFVEFVETAREYFRPPFSEPVS